MFFALKGNVFRLEPMKLLLEVSGVVYEVAISLMTYSKLGGQKEVFVYVSPIVREDSHLLFGFACEMEKNIFDRLIKINGVGPKVALAILSTYSAQEFTQIVQNKDVGALQKVSGIGAKSASKIMVDIAGFYVELLPKEENDFSAEALLALESLGFKKNAIEKVLKGLKADSVGELVKKALSLLG